jgi:hypothetical protein
MASARPISETEMRLRGLAAPVFVGVAALLAPEDAEVGSTNTVVSAVTTRAGAILVGKSARVAEARTEAVAEEFDELERVEELEALAELAVELSACSDEMTGIVVDTPEVVALPGRLANPIAAGWYRYTE